MAECKELAIIVDDDQVYMKQAKNILEEVGFRAEATSNPQQAKDLRDIHYPRGAALIVIDNRYDGQESYWQELVVPLRQKHPDALILLVSGLSDKQLEGDIKNIEKSEGNKQSDFIKILGSDPFIHYLPKGEGIAYGNHNKYLKNFAEKLLRKINNRRELQALLLQCAYQSAIKLLETSLKKLIKEIQNPEKQGIYQLDVEAENYIKETFVPEMHYKNIVICTEEKGVHNELYHRVQNPDFFIFSDPFDGSTNFTSFVETLINSDENLAEQSISGIPDEKINEYWKSGHISLNSPMVSIVLSERHRVVGAVLINLFTRDVYLSIDKGNYYKQIPSIDNNDFISRELYSCIRGGKCIDGIDNWKKIKFRTWDDLRSTETKKLFLCSMPEDKNNRRMKHTKKHIKPLFLESWEKSYNYRKNQLNFTPGPGRILFFMDIPQLHKYEEESLDSNCYQYILSAGELLTEWIGWFAFLRHSKNLSAYCLRNPSIPYLKYKEDDPSSMTPSELESIFRDGFIDIGILHTAYGRKMWKYKDTILICYDNDSQWKKNYENETTDKPEPYLKVPLFQKKQV